MKILVVDNPQMLECYKNCIDRVSDIDFVSDVSSAIDIIEKSGKKYGRIITEILFEDNNVSGFDILKIAKNYGIKERIILTSISRPMLENMDLANLIIRKPISRRKIDILFSESMKILKKEFSVKVFSESSIFASSRGIFI